MNTQPRLNLKLLARGVCAHDVSSPVRVRAPAP